MASVTFTHAHDHAVVAFTGELDWDAARELVDVIDTCVHEFFYTVVELVVSSQGGQTAAFEFYLGQREEWRRRGLRLRTRILSSAASAAAILVALGDERVAEPGATLSFHGAHVSPERGVNARASASISSVLRDIDDRMLALLAARAVASDEDVVHEAELADRTVLEQLWAEFGRSGKAPRKVRGLARGVGRYVERAVRRGDRDALTRLYRRLFEIECTLSARLALTLRLLDRVGPRETKAPRSAGSPTLTVPEWRALFPPSGEVPREVLTRHVLIMGETGSGKTASCILPVAAAMARAPRERLATCLVIDPKRELEPVLEALAPERLRHLLAEEIVLDVMSGPRWSLVHDRTARRWVSAARRILCRVASLVPSSPAHVLMAHTVANDNIEFFNREGTSLAQTVLAFVLMVTDPRTPDPEQWLGHDVEAFAWADDLVERARGCGDERGPNALALAAWALEGPLLSCPPSGRAIAVSRDEPSVQRMQWLFGRLALAAFHRLCDGPGEGRDLCDRIVQYWAPMADIDRQFAGVRATASVVCADFAAPSVATRLYFGCEPGYLSARFGGGELDFARLVAPDGPGDLLLFQPARDQLDNLIATTLKACFFEAVLDDPDRAKGAPDLPLVGYVSDEFHRFVTSDPLHGEQSFLDTCRSFGAFCVLACQSVASIEHALAHGGGTDLQNRSSVEILCQNTATKLIFRSTDPSTLSRVDDLCPSRPGIDALVRVRPVSTLAIGEAYVALADGRFERRQLEPYRGARPDPDRIEPVALLEGPAPQPGRP